MEQCYSDASFHRRRIHVIRKDVRFTLKGRSSNNRNYSLSNSHVRIAFENILTFLTAITIYKHLSLAAVTSITLENGKSVFKNVFQQHMVTYGYPTLWLMCQWYSYGECFDNLAEPVIYKVASTFLASNINCGGLRP